MSDWINPEKITRDDEVPAFVEFEGTLGTQGQIWRIETVSPRRPG